MAILKEVAPIQRETTREKVSAVLRDAILSGRLAVGQRLPEIDLTLQLKVSRSAIREALQQLAHEGLVVLNSHRGAQVVDLSPEEIDEIIAVRTLLEPEAVRLASRLMSPSERVALVKAAESLEASRPTPQEFIRQDRAFHESIWHYSRNATLQKHLTLLTSPLFSMGTILRRSAAIAEGTPVMTGPGDHRTLARLIAEGPNEDAVSAIREHITENWSRTKELVGKLHDRGRSPAKRKASR